MERRDRVATAQTLDRFEEVRHHLNYPAYLLLKWRWDWPLEGNREGSSEKKIKSMGNEEVILQLVSPGNRARSYKVKELYENIYQFQEIGN